MKDLLTNIGLIFTAALSWGKQTLSIESPLFSIKEYLAIGLISIAMIKRILKSKP